MYQAFFSSFQAPLDSLNQLAKIHQDTARELVALRSEFIASHFSQQQEHTQALATSQDAKALVDCQIDYLQRLQSQWQQAAKQEMSTLENAREQFATLAQSQWQQLTAGQWFEQCQSVFDTLSQGMDFQPSQPANEADIVAQQQPNAVVDKPAVDKPAVEKAAVETLQTAAPAVNVASIDKSEANSTKPANKATASNAKVSKNTARKSPAK